MIIFISGLFFTSCKKDKKPTITVEFIDGSGGWYGDTVKLNITVSSEENFTVNITNDHDSQSFQENYASGSTTITYGYAIPNDLAEGDKVKITIVATNNESLLSETVEKEISITNEGTGETIVHEGTITADETWSASNVHVVEGTFYVSGCTLTIAPGTVIKMNAGSAMYIGDEPNSKLIAQGTDSQPITFTSGLSEKNPGDWDRIYFDSGTLSSSVMEYCVVEYGGGDDYYNYMLGLRECEISIKNSTFKNSASRGIAVMYLANLSTFTNNTVEECSSDLMSLEPNAVHTLGTTNTFNSTTQGIMIDAKSSSTFSLQNATWYKQTVPYILNDYLEIESANGSTLTIEPGVTIKIQSGFGIRVGDGEQGALIAAGTSSQPITFTSANSTVAAGDWEFIAFFENSINTSKLDYCVIDYAGGDEYYDYAVLVKNCEIKIDNSTIRNSASSGIVLDYGAKFLSFTNNTIENCATYLIEIEPNAIHTIGTGNTLTTSDYGVYIDDDDYTLLSEVTWPELTCSYIVDGSISIGNENGSGAVLRIAPGASFKFKTDANFDIGYHAAQIFFEGTAEKPITFTTGYNTVQAGQWDNLRFKSNLAPGSILDYCNIIYGGGDSNYQGNIYLNTNNLTIQNCEISNSANYGIYMYNSAAPANSDWQTVNNFHDNASGDWNN